MGWGAQGWGDRWDGGHRDGVTDGMGDTVYGTEIGWISMLTQWSTVGILVVFSCHRDTDMRSLH